MLSFYTDRIAETNAIENPSVSTQLKKQMQARSDLSLTYFSSVLCDEFLFIFSWSVLLSKTPRNAQSCIL